MKLSTNAPLRDLRTIGLAMMLVFGASACGGGGGGGSASAVIPVVGTVTGSMKYSAASTITVAGTDLSAVTVSASGACASLTEQAGGTATERSFACTPRWDAVVPCAAADGSCAAVAGRAYVAVTVRSGSAVLAQTALPIPDPQVTMATSLGSFVVELKPANAPLTVNNFLRYVGEGFYADTLFHRVAAGFVVQGGGYSTAGVEKATHAPIVLEAPAQTGLSNVVGSIAMARTSEHDSATSQFFVNTADHTASNTTDLDTGGGGYAVFGSVISGMPVIQTIEVQPTSSQATGNVPLTPIVLNSAIQTQ